MSLTAFIEKYGRKFALAVFALIAGLLVTVIGIVSAVANPDAASHISMMVVAFSALVTAATSVFTAGQSAVEVKHGATTPADPITARSSGTFQGPQ